MSPVSFKKLYNAEKSLFTGHSQLTYYNLATYLNFEQAKTQIDKLPRQNQQYKITVEGICLITIHPVMYVLTYWPPVRCSNDKCHRPYATTVHKHKTQISQN